jgi:hypothetical protein
MQWIKDRTLIDVLGFSGLLHFLTTEAQRGFEFWC